jgi:hypothetical protein
MPQKRAYFQAKKYLSKAQMLKINDSNEVDLKFKTLGKSTLDEIFNQKRLRLIFHNHLTKITLPYKKGALL